MHVKNIPLCSQFILAETSFFRQKYDVRGHFAKKSFEPAFTSELFYIESYKRPVLCSEPVMFKLCNASGQTFPKSFYSYQIKKAIVLTSQKLKVKCKKKTFYRNGIKYNIVNFEKFGNKPFEIKQANMKFYDMA